MADGMFTPKHVPPELVFEFDIYADPRIGEDVQGDYFKVLSTAPDIFWTPCNGGHWVVQRYDAIGAITKDYEHFSVREMQIPRVPNPPFFIPLSLDPPANLPYRQVMMPAFSPKSVTEMEPKLREWAQRMVDEVAAKGACDFLHDIAARYPVSIFMELMGMDLNRLREFREKADHFFNAHDPEGLEKASAEIIGDLQALMAEKKKNPDNKLVTHFQNVEVEGGRKLSDDEVLAMVFILFLGGMDTVTNVTAFAYRQLANDPDLQARLRADAKLIPKFVEEALRCFAVVNSPRLVVKDCERFGVNFHEGEMVLNMLPMGSRDDRQLEDPSRFNIDRAQSTHITFSSGPHLCLGHLLARAEMRVLTEEWLKRIPSFRAKPGVAHPFRIGTVCAILSLPLEWDVQKAS